MITELQKIINFKNFFKISNYSNNNVIYHFRKPSRMLLHNIYKDWLLSTCLKSTKNFPIFVNRSIEQLNKRNVPFGLIRDCHLEDSKNHIIHNLSFCAPEKTTMMQLDLYVPKLDVMQYFIQWQRYRKYWWSSITTTPSLFSLNEVKHEEGVSDIDIVANFLWGQQVVETVTLDNRSKVVENSACISCSMTLENALFILLLDGLNDNEYLRLHRKMAPYKISFALNYKGLDLNNKGTLKELAILMYNHLETHKVSCWLPDFSLSTESQIKENLLMGVPYTVIISEGTLSDGIIHLLNSNTTLKVFLPLARCVSPPNKKIIYASGLSSALFEQIHIADINTYAASLFQK